MDKNFKNFPSAWGGDVKAGIISSDNPQQLIWNISASKLSEDHTIGMQNFIADKMEGRKNELESFKKVVIKAKTTNSEPLRARFSFVNTDAQAFSHYITLTNEMKDFEIPLSDLKSDVSMLLPRPYPEFMPLWFKPSTSLDFKLNSVEKFEITVGSDLAPSEFKKPYNMQVESIRLEK